MSLFYEKYFIEWYNGLLGPEIPFKVGGGGLI